MINRITKYILLFFFFIIIITVLSLTFNADLRRSTLFRIMAVHDFYQLESLLKYVETRDFSNASNRLLNYIELSKKISSEKSSMMNGIYEATNLVTSIAITQEEFNLLEKVFSELIKLDQNLYKPRVWLARAISDTDYKSALMHLEKAIEISPASEDAYREGIRIAQNKSDAKLAQKFCDEYVKAQLGGFRELYTTNYFGTNNIRKMAVEFSPEKENSKFYPHAGVQLNNFQTYEFVPAAPIDMNGVNLYFSSLPGIRVLIKEISIYYSGKVLKIPAQDFTASSRSAYIYNNEGENLSFLLVNGENDILRLRYKDIFKSVDKIKITMNFVRMLLANNLLCKKN